MSSTGRKKKNGLVTPRRNQDFYSTPLKTTRSLLEVPEVKNILVPQAHILEPCAGDLATVHALDDYCPEMQYSCVEVRKSEYYKHLAFQYARNLDLTSYFMDFRGFYTQAKVDIIITNPPFFIWQEITEKALTICPRVCMLLRLGVLGSKKKRNKFWKEHKPLIAILSDRPSFTQDGNTDSDYYAWFMWGCGREGEYTVI
jgi:predicted RNA methylase